VILQTRKNSVIKYVFLISTLRAQTTEVHVFLSISKILAEDGWCGWV